MIVSEPFTVAYGMERMSDILVVDIGAGTTDLCRMHGTVPTDEDEISYPIAGDAVDLKLMELIQQQVSQGPGHAEHVQVVQGELRLRLRRARQNRSPDARRRQAHAARHHAGNEERLRNPDQPDR
jgi:actin-like ATPase involved in cell morphogenesis